MPVVVEAVYGCVLDGSVYALDLAVCPSVFHLGQRVFDAVLEAHPVKQVPHLRCCGTIAISSGMAVLDTIID